MCFITKNITNWKYILVVVVLATIVSASILSLQQWILKNQTPIVKITTNESIESIENKEIKESEKNKDISGIIGVELKEEENKLIISAIFRGKPADEAGLKVDDEITKVNNIPTNYFSYEENIQLIRGIPGTEVMITIKREGWEKEREFKIKRIAIEALSPVSGKFCQEPNELVNIPEEELAELKNLPEFPSEFFWKRSLENHLENEKIVNYGTSGGYLFGDSSFCGQEWIAIVENFTHEEIIKFNQSFSSFDSEFLNLGWERRISEGGFEITGVAADGPDGGMWGYVKVQNGRLRTVVLSRHYTRTQKSLDDNYGERDPSGMEFRIFISDIVSLDKILP